MGNTQLVNISNRWLDTVHLSVAVSAVPLDAVIVETFQLPVGFGQLLLQRIVATIDTLSGAYVAPAPAYDGVDVDVVDTNLTTVVDSLYVRRFVNIYTETTRPVLSTSWDFWTNLPLVRQREAFRVVGPVLAGAGVTGRVAFRVTGRRIMTA